MLRKLAKNDFKTKYAGSYLGVVWAFVQPVITVLLYFFVFQVVFQNKSEFLGQGVETPYVLWLTAGLVPWFYFSDVVINGAQTLLTYHYLVKKVVFQIELLPLVRCLSALFVHGFFVLVLIVMCVIGSVPFHVSVIQVVYYSGCLFVFCLALSYLFSAVTVFFKDLVQLLNVLLQVFMWATPIMWNIHYLDKHPAIQTVLMLNPLYYVVNGYREALFENKWMISHPYLTLWFWGITIVLLVLGRTVFQRLRPHFADVL